MFRWLTQAALCGACLVPGLGCANVLEKHAIQKFTNGLQGADLPALKASTSTGFEHKALRHEAAIATIKDLKIPSGKPEILKVEEKDNVKDVTVALGEKKTKILFKLTRDTRTGKWVVDDVVSKQRKKGQPAPKSVAEQMDLLLCVHECLDAWESAAADQIMAGATAEFATLLGELPQAKLLEVVKHVTGDELSHKQLRPEAQINEETAIVRVPRKLGQMLISFRRVEDRWRVDDVAVESKQDGAHIPSVHRFRSRCY